MQADAVKDGPRDGYPLATTAKRYWLPELAANADDPDALTLVLLHSTSFHKETWEPSLEKLLKLSAQQGSRVSIREAWAIDCPNHGEAGHLNERSLANDMRKLRIVSYQMDPTTPLVPFKSLIIVEPLISPAGPQHLNKLRSILVKGAHERRDVWPDRQMAMVMLKKRERTKKWDPRITELFVQHAVVPHPGSYEKETPYTGVTLACTRDQEAAMYRDADGPIKPVEDLRKICAVIPVHLILAGVNDFLPARVHAAIQNPEYGGRYASVHKVSGVGHLIPQEEPDKLGVIMYDALALDQAVNIKTKL
ncbi:hypothetical protein H0H81_002736 [Sphagnurus paluster]|uniref:AB hydrolase-1 domain-containing protein n=1 Tax=Sphagnurus paluster TaxID=117069 RepID=A0A9P7FX25_9AGAR|nr:hypothetical protein H0H81_002736 [Sphagnurus paluster]